MRIGIDIGNVIIGGGGEDTSFFTDDYLKTPEIADAWGSISAMAGMEHEVHLVSKCGPIVEERSMIWLEQAYFLNRVPAQRVHFVRKRHLKAPMAQALQLEVFVDDRQDIIDSLQGIVPYPILFTSWEETNRRLEEIWNSLKKAT